MDRAATALAHPAATGSSAALAASSACSQCGTAFRCGMTAGDAQCWCYELPHTVPVPEKSATTSANAAGPAGMVSCLCPVCLQHLMEKT